MTRVLWITSSDSKSTFWRWCLRSPGRPHLTRYRLTRHRYNLDSKGYCRVWKVAVLESLREDFINRMMTLRVTWFYYGLCWYKTFPKHNIAFWLNRISTNILHKYTKTTNFNIPESPALKIYDYKTPCQYFQHRVNLIERFLSTPLLLIGRIGKVELLSLRAKSLRLTTLFIFRHPKRQNRTAPKRL